MFSLNFDGRVFFVTYFAVHCIMKVFLLSVILLSESIFLWCLFSAFAILCISRCFSNRIYLGTSICACYNLHSFLYFPTNNKNWIIVYTYRTVYWANVLATVPTRGQFLPGCLWPGFKFDLATFIISLTIWIYYRDCIVYIKVVFPRREGVLSLPNPLSQDYTCI